MIEVKCIRCGVGKVKVSGNASRKVECLDCRRKRRVDNADKLLKAIFKGTDLEKLIKDDNRDLRE